LLAGRYRILAPLGKGGSAQLYRVLDVARGETLALKLMPRETHEKLRELFELEYQTLASLTHPRTVQVYELGSDVRGDFYTMELLPGEDLSEHAPVPWRDVCDYLRDASEALGLLHARKLIHRDVSPKNLWRCPDGRVKLIDFGALAPFGRTSHVIGTPPFVPPEALELRGLDQHADLYALGAVAYFLLTGRHAYPARTMQDLSELWARPLLPPSACTAELEPIPPELDALVLALLSLHEGARPADTAEVIDRLDALRGASRGSDVDSAEARLRNAAFVGRARELRQLSRMLLLAERGRGQLCTIECEPGMGRSRMLAELGLSARMARATVLHVTAAADGAPYSCASELCLALFDALPELAHAAAAPHAALLAHLSPAMQRRLGVSAAPAPEIPGELRIRINDAVSELFASVARQRLLCVMVDGLEHADDGSAACLLALGSAPEPLQLLLVASLPGEATLAPGLTVRAFRQAARRVPLGPLTDLQLSELLGSVFGAAEHLPRLANRLFRATRGNPGHALALCRELIHAGEISSVNGSWVLPRELPDELLTRSREQLMAAMQARLSAPARELMRLLSLHAGALSPGVCRLLAAVGGDNLLPHLGELLGEGVLIPAGANVQFAYDSFRRACAAALSPELTKRARRALAEHLLGAVDAGVLDRLQAGVHLLAADDARGLGIVLSAGSLLMAHEIDRLAAAAPALEEALGLCEERALSAYQRASLLAALVMAGYLGDRRYVDRYANPAVHTLQELCGMPLARRLRPYLGGLLALLAALGVSALRYLRDGRRAAIPNFTGLLQLLFTSVATVAGTKSICFDPDAAQAYADVLEPFSKLGMHHIGGFMSEYCQVIAATTRDGMSEPARRWRSLLALLDDPRRYSRLMTPPLRSLARGGALFGLASLEVYRDTSEALRLAERLEQSGLSLDRVFADQTHTVFHGQRGDMLLHKRYLGHAELHAIGRGTTWQVETWSPGPMTSLALLTHDALLAKHASEQMRRLSESLPSLVPHARHMRGVYLMLRGRHVQALPWLESVLAEPPAARAAWTHSHGVLARTYNKLGDHARAHAACQRVLEHAAPEDFDFCYLNMIVQTERAIACAGLGQPAEAAAQLRALHALHDANGSPLLMGALHEAELEIALLAGDVAGARGQLQAMERAYQTTLAPSLSQHCRSLGARLAGLAGDSAASDDARAWSTTSSQPTSAGDWSSELKASVHSSLADQAQRALQILARKVQADRGVLYLTGADGAPRLAATLALAQPSAELELWARQRLLRELDGDERTQRADAPADQRAPAVLHEGGVSYRSYVLCVRDPESPVVGMAALGREQDAPAACPNDLLRGVAQHLREASSLEAVDSVVH